MSELTINIRVVKNKRKIFSRTGRVSVALQRQLLKRK